MFTRYVKEKDSDKSQILDPKVRLDFHAKYTEIYLLIVMVLSITLYYFKVLDVFPNLLKYAVIGVFLIESFVWVFYYMLARVLLERYLTIYNEVEYLISLPVVIATQVFLISLLVQNLSPSEVLSLMFGIGGVNGSLEFQVLALGLMGVVYVVIVIANLIRIVPSISVLKRPNITIIGAGDVVENRILKALLKLYEPSQIAVVSDVINDEFKSLLSEKNIYYKEVFFKKEGASQKNALYSHKQRESIKNKIIEFVKSRSTYAIIATPSDEHFSYIQALANEGIKFAVEKPICVAIPQLKMLKANGKGLMNNGFLLSYYWLEKGLPLNYFLTLNPIYRDLLKVSASNETLDTPSSLAYVKESLGEPRLIVSEFLEGDETENRFWTEIPETGGLIAETLIHPITMIKNILGSQAEIKWGERAYVKVKERKTLIQQKYNIDIGFTYIDWIGKSGDCNIRLRLGKYTDKKRRVMHATYENGKIVADFDKQTCSVYLKAIGGSGKEIEKFTIKLLHEGKYETQMLLFHEYIQRGWNELRYDDFPNQIDVLIDSLSGVHGKAEKNEIEISRSELNIWLDENPLISSGESVINNYNIKDRFGPQEKKDKI